MSSIHFFTDMVIVRKASYGGSFLFEVEVKEEKKCDLEKQIIGMQLHGLEGFSEDLRENTLSNTEKSFVEVNGTTYLSGHTCRWQLQGVIKAMEALGFDMDHASKSGVENGLMNGVSRPMEYDTMVCRRGFLRGSKIFLSIISFQTNSS